MTISSVGTNSQIAQAQQTQQYKQQSVQAQQKNQEQPEDTVVLSKQASGTGDAAQGDPDHDGH
ncbi:MAG TPA: hypothetical protein VK724_15060 [Bryobacteraceae bacterium]|jgi:hypothetical protein|nr:hypothetical protein [Bryobacteraceae bacterium]